MELSFQFQAYFTVMIALFLADWRCHTQIPSIRKILLIQPEINTVPVQCLLGHNQILHNCQGRFSKG